MPSKVSKETSKKARETPEALKTLKMHNGSPALFGELRFPACKKDPSKWACFAPDTKGSDMLTLLCETWGLPRPPVLISVTGAAGSLEMKGKDRAIFKRGLREAARRTQAWIVTGGTNSGVMSMVGSMVAETDEDTPHNTVCLGVVPWGAVHRHESLAEKGSGKVYLYEDFEVRKGKHAALDPNHSHFLFVDDGSAAEDKRCWGAEIPTRAALENELCQEDDSSKSEFDDVLNTPMVLVVVGGGPGTLDTIIASLKNERPVVILADSGGVATQIYRYWMFGEMPALSKEMNSLGEPVNKKDIAALSEKLPEIVKLGKVQREQPPGRWPPGAPHTHTHTHAHTHTSVGSDRPPVSQHHRTAHSAGCTASLPRPPPHLSPPPASLLPCVALHLCADGRQCQQEEAPAVLQAQPGRGGELGPRL
jgi:hypothetical protein